MKIDSQYCTAEQATRLQELGVKIPVYSVIDSRLATYTSRIKGPYVGPDNKTIEVWHFSVGELLDLLPSDVERQGALGSYNLEITKDEMWWIEYWYWNIGGEKTKQLIGFTGESLAQAAADMLIYLLENKYMTL